MSRSELQWFSTNMNDDSHFGFCLFSLSIPFFMLVKRQLCRDQGRDLDRDAVSLRKEFDSRLDDNVPTLAIIVDIGSSSIKCTCTTCPNLLTNALSKNNTNNNICGEEIFKTTSCKREWTLREVNVQDFNKVYLIVLELIAESLVAYKKQLILRRKRCGSSSSKYSGMCKVASVGFTSFGMSLVGVDKETGKCSSHLSYQGVPSDPEFVPFCEVAIRRLQADRKSYHSYRRKLGTSFFHPSYALCQLLYHLKQSKGKESSSSIKQLAWMSMASFVTKNMISKSSKKSEEEEKKEKEGSENFVNIISPSEASWCGIFEFFNQKWCYELLINEGIFPDVDAAERALPTIEYPEDRRRGGGGGGSGGVCIPADFSIPELRGALVYQGLVDGAAAAIGSLLCPLSTLKSLYVHPDFSKYSKPSGSICIETEDKLKSIRCNCKNTLSVTIGTSSAMRYVTHVDAYRDTYDDDAAGAAAEESSSASRTNNAKSSNLFRYRINKDFIVIGGALTDGGSLISWWKSTIAGSSECAQELLSDFDDLVCRNNGCDFASYCHANRNSIPVVLPFFSGERNPGWKLNSQGHILGIDISTSKFDILVSLALGVISQLRGIQDSLYDLKLLFGEDKREDSVVVVSGGTLETSAGWRQLLADMLGCPVVLNKSSDIELTTLGVLNHIEYLNRKDSDNDVDVASEGWMGGDIQRLTVRDIALPRIETVVSLGEFLQQYCSRADLYYSMISL